MVAVESLVDLLDQALEHVVAVTDRVDGDELVEPVVEVDDRHRDLFVDLEPSLDRFLGVVVALHHPPTAHVALPVVGWRHVHVVVRAAVLTDAATGDAVEDDLGGHLEAQHDVERVVGGDDGLELLGLWERAWEPVEDESLFEELAGEALVDDLDDGLVGHQLAGVHVALGFESGRCAFRRRGVEELTG